MLNLILPHEGLYCVAIQQDKGFQHKWWSSVADAHANAMALDAAGKTVFIAQASFATNENRKQVNVHRLRSFWMDIDCGEGKPYATQLDGINALRKFLEATGLPTPIVVNSGNGLYAQWPLTEDVLLDQWRSPANILKSVATAYGFEIDQTRTGDASSVLRPIGSHNKKRGEYKEVHVIKTAAVPTEFSHFASLLQRAADSKNIKASTLTAPGTYTGLNDDFISGISGGGPPCSGVEAAKHCAQLAKFRDKLGDIPEPEWYAGIGVLRHCEEGEAIIQEWSIGHPTYSPDATRAKIEQHKLPPTTCQHFGSLNPTGCVGCSHSGKIKTPIVLGRKNEKVDVTQEDVDRCDPPCGFAVRDNGIYFEADELRVYPYDIYPTLLAWDDSLGYETLSLRHKTPHNGWKSFAIRAGALHDKKSAIMLLNDNHVQLVGTEEKKLMLTYLEQYEAKLRAKRSLTRLYAQMGWREEDGELVFILGNYRYAKGKEPEQVGFAKNVPEVAKSFKAQGSLEEWVNGTDVFGAPGMEPHYFPVVAGAFASVGLRFTGYEGALISCVGDSGSGKTLQARIIQSVYGDPGRLMMLRDDTKNSLVARLGVYGSLPVTIDEITNIDAMELSDLVYRITQGRDKARLSRNGSERNILNHWNTIAVTSSNSSLIEKLSTVKSDASAEINRIMEIYVNPNVALGREAATALYRTINANYGVAGPKFIQYLVDHADEHREQLDKIAALLVERAECKNEERFQVALAAATLYFGNIAYRLGLLKHDMRSLTPWIIAQLKNARAVKRDMVSDSVSILGGFLGRFAPNGIVVCAANASQPMNDPRGQIVYRYEVETGKCFISRDVLRTELQRMHTDFTRFRVELRDMGVLLNPERRKTLTSGIAAFTGAQQLCWELDMTHPAVGHVAARVVDPPSANHLKTVGIK